MAHREESERAGVPVVRRRREQHDVQGRCTVALVLVLLVSIPVQAQSDDLAERSHEATRAMQDGRFDEAARLYRDLLQALPNEAGLLMNLGMALAMGGHEREALAPLERALALNPELVPARMFLGSSYLALGQPEKAIEPR